MAVCTCPPANRDAVIRRRLEKGPQHPPEVRSVWEWSYTGGGRVQIDTRGITAVVCAGDPARAGRGDAPPR